jgi:DNA invertase Pin-like site-specific DNA recombinase
VCQSVIYRTSREPRRRFCSKDCFATWQRISLGPQRSEQARQRVLAVHDDGVRGANAIARAARSSLTTVYRVLRSEGREIASDAPSASAS